MNKRLLLFATLGLAGGLLMAAPAQAANPVFVDDDWDGLSSPTMVVFTYPGGSTANAQMGLDAFATMTEAVAAADSGADVYVAPGTYIEEALELNLPINLHGPNAGVNPVTETRGDEAILLPATNDPVNNLAIYLNSANISIEGFTLDGDNPALSGGVNLNGADANSGYGMFNSGTDSSPEDNFTLVNNVVKNFAVDGVNFFNTVSAITIENAVISNNVFDNFWRDTPNQHAIVFGNSNIAGTISGNEITRSYIGIQLNLNSKGSTPMVVADNNLTVRRVGIWRNQHTSTAPKTTIEGNTIKAESISTNLYGIMLTSSAGSTVCHIINNSVEDALHGVDFWNARSTNPVSVFGHVSLNCGEAVSLYDVHPSFGATSAVNYAYVEGLQVLNTPASKFSLKRGVSVFDNTGLANFNLNMTVRRSSFAGVDTGVFASGERAFVTVKDCAFEGTNAASSAGLNATTTGGNGANITMHAGLISGFETGALANGPIVATGVTFLDNGRDFDVTQQAASSRVTYSNFDGSGIGVNNSTGTPVNAQSNWWGDPAGPTPITRSGDNVTSGVVSYTPFLTSFLTIPDSDGDGLTNGQEDVNANGVVDAGETNPAVKDSDVDGVEDGVEVALASDPLDNGSVPGVIPGTADTDGDGFEDFYEVAVGSKSDNPDSVPGLADADGDGRVDNIDGVVAANVFLGNFALTDFYHWRMDADRSGTLTNTDAVAIFNFFLGNAPVETLPLN